VLSPFSSCKTTPEVVIYALTKWRTHKQMEKKRKLGVESGVKKPRNKGADKGGLKGGA